MRYAHDLMRRHYSTDNLEEKILLLEKHVLHRLDNLVLNDYRPHLTRSIAIKDIHDHYKQIIRYKFVLKKTKDKNEN